MCTTTSLIALNLLHPLFFLGGEQRASLMAVVTTRECSYGQLPRHWCVGLLSDLLFFILMISLVHESILNFVFKF